MTGNRDREPQRVEVLSTERIHDDGFFAIDRARIRLERFGGGMSAPMTRLVCERGDAVAVLPYHRERRQVVLVQQFRYPVHVRGDRAWTWEIIAGIQDGGRAPEGVARAEAMEEAGLELDDLRRVLTIYPSPGGSSERVHIYLAPYTEERRVAPGGGLAEHGEDIRVCVMGLDEALRMVAEGRIVDAKTVVALLYLQAQWAEM